MANIARSQNPCSQLANALWAIERGFRVVPLQAAGKNPNGHLVPHGVTESTRDEEQVRGWWSACPNGNVGIHGGAIVDCDAGIHSLEQAERWRERAGLPATLAVRTGRRTSYGVQFHYRGQTASGPYEFNGVAGEVRSGNLYGLAPGSIHPDTGERYHLVIDLPIADYPPDSALERAKKKIQKTLVRSTRPEAGQEDPTLLPPILAGIPVRPTQANRSQRRAVIRGAPRAVRHVLRKAGREDRQDAAPDLRVGRAELRVHAPGIADARLATGLNEPGPSKAKIPPDPADKDDTVPDRRPITDVSNAERLIRRFGDEIVYVSDRDVWCVWDGKIWIVDDILGVARRMKAIALDIYFEASRESGDDKREGLVKWGQKSESQKTQLHSIEPPKTLPSAAASPNCLMSIH